VTRIAHLITGLDVGGAERMLVRLLTRMDRSRYDNVVISMLPPGPMADALRGAGVPVHTLAMRRGIPNPVAAARLVRLLRRLRPRILQTWLYHADVIGILVGRLAGVRHIVWNLRAADVDMGPYGAVSQWTRRIGSWTSSWPDAVVVNSHAGRQAHEAVGYRPRRWAWIPNGVDLLEFRPSPGLRAAVRREWNVSDEAFVFGVVGRWDPIKGIDLVVDAAAALGRPRACFVLVGRGLEPGNAALTGPIDRARLRGHVRLLGERTDVARLHAGFDCLVMPSRGEGCPNAVVEAMASGLPCVVTDVGDAAFLVGDTGWVVAPEDRTALAEACRRAIDQPIAETRRLGDAARARVARHFAIDQVSRTYETFYDSLT
jgi:glycosyltransferase involved in cell wall biosynthesis